MNKTKLEIKTWAKINLFLEVTSKREDNYHNLKTLFHTVSLHDNLSMELTRGKRNTKSENLEINISSNHKNIPLDENNLVHKAVKLIVDTFYKGDSKLIFKIHIDKFIPPEGGLAGGSSNCAGALILCNKLLDLGLEYEELVNLGAKLGADVPFCLKIGTAIGTGIGDNLKYLDDFPQLDLIIALPDFSISTPWVFKNLNIKTLKNSVNILDIIENIKTEKKYNLYNALESVVEPQYPSIKKIKNELLRLGCKTSLMSGSGSTVFGIMDKTSDFNNICNNFSIPDVKLIKCKSQYGDI